MEDRLELISLLEDGRVRLLAPAPGLFTRALDRGCALSGGQEAGTLLRLSRASLLVAPTGVAGQITTPRPERVHQPVSFGDVLYELAPFSEGAAGREAEDAAQEAGSSGSLLFLSPQAGRFYLRPTPSDPPFAQAGDVLEPGKPIGLIEVMKTFTHLQWQPRPPLPERARLIRFLVSDASDVAEGQALCEVEPA
jgi:biotin carboxyl carrier protein